jgi:hypothetical protein
LKEGAEADSKSEGARPQKRKEANDMWEIVDDPNDKELLK